MLAFSRSSPFGHGIVRTILCSARSYCTQRRRADVEAVDQLGRRRGHHHHEPVQRIGLERCVMRTFLLPSLSVNVSIVLRAAMSMISTFSIAASTV